jgi:hypothetical protein
MTGVRLSILAAVAALMAVACSFSLMPSDDECHHALVMVSTYSGDEYTGSYSGGATTGTLALVWPEGARDFDLGADLTVVGQVAREWRLDDAGADADAGASVDAGAGTADAGTPAADGGASAAPLPSGDPVGEPIGQASAPIAVVRLGTDTQTTPEGSFDLTTIRATIVRCSHPLEALKGDSDAGYYCASAVRRAPIVEPLSGTLSRRTSGTTTTLLVDGQTARGTRVTLSSTYSTSTSPGSGSSGFTYECPD